MTHARVAIAKFLKWLFRNAERVDCRCCHAALHEPGGYGIALIGCGFCSRCSSEILKK